MLAMPWRGVGSCTRHSGLPSPNENERCRLRRRCPPAHCPQDRVEHHVEFLADVFGEEAQHEISVLLKQLIFAPIAAIGDWIGEMLGAVELHRDTRVGAQQVDFQTRQPVERDRQRMVDGKAALGFLQRFQPPEYTGSVRKRVSSRGSSNPSPTYLPVATMTRGASGGIASSRAATARRCFVPRPARSTTT